MGVNWKAILGGVAPVLAKALGGPAAVAAPALTALSKLLLGRDGAAEGDVAAAIAGATPEQLEKLRTLEQEFALKLVDSAVQLEKMEADDRANARAREIAVKDRMPALLAWTLTGMVGGLLAVLAFVRVPPENREAFMMLLGSVGTAWVGAMTYYHGTSASSRAKDVVLGKLAKSG